MIRAVIFDLGGVIVPLDFPSGYRALAARCPVPMEQIPERVAATGLVPLYESGQIGDDEFRRRFCEALSLTVDEAEFRRLWSSIFQPHTLIPESLLVGLKQQGYRLLLLSNTNNLHFEMIRDNYPLLGHFDDLVLSYEVGVTKPARRIYEVAVARAGCHPQECFYTDDIAAYVEAARTAGLDAVQFHTCEQLTAELAARQIHITTQSPIFRQRESPVR